MTLALVTGGATGIGAACCRALAGAGMTVAIHHRTSAAAAEDLRQELGPEAFLVQADLATAQGVDALYEEMRARGGLDVLVNNAGATVDAPLFSARLEDFDRLVATNMRSTWYLTKRLARLMMRRKTGRIINISSVVGSTGNPGQSIYGMTKAALDNFTRTAALEMADYGILVNAVAPGFIQTAMTEVLAPEIREGILGRVPLKRMGTPEEVAALVRFLAVEATYCTGTTFHVNGGMYGG